MASIYSMVIGWRGAGQIWENVLHYQVDESGGARPEQYASALITAWRTSVLSDWLDCLSEQANMVSQKCKKVTAPGSVTSIEAFADGVHQGTIAGDLDITAEAGILEFPYHSATRTAIAKIFVAGLPENSVVNNEIQSAERALLLTLANAITVPITTAAPIATATYVGYNRVTKVGTIPESHAVAIKVGIQRRRLLPTF